MKKAAKIIRILTVPPILVMLLTVILYWLTPDIFHNLCDMILTICFLGIIPILAYPLQLCLPHFKEKGRSGQRTLAFILSIIGYISAVIYGYAVHAASSLQLIYNTYLISVILLTFLNKACKLRASGHACSITAPCIFLICFGGRFLIFPALLVFIASIWASLYLKRHTKADILLGVSACAVSFVIALLFC